MGGTTIVCGVKAETAEPDLEKPDEGFLGMARRSPFQFYIELVSHFSAKC